MALREKKTLEKNMKKKLQNQTASPNGEIDTLHCKHNGRKNSSGIPLSSRARAVTGNVAFRPTGIASTLLRLRAVSADVADARAVVALRALDAVTRQVTYTTASIAGLASAAAASKATSSVSSAVSSSSSSSAGSIRARTRNVSSFATAIAFST